MAANSNMDPHMLNIHSSFHNGRIVSFQSGAAVNSSAPMISGGINNLLGSNSMVSTFMPESPDMINYAVAMTPSRNSSLAAPHEPMLRFMHVSGSPAYWSPKELEILNQGLVRYANESSIKKYIKISAMLPDKTIRDVALRCQWMTDKETGKRRKTEGHYAVKRMKDMKIMASPATANIHMASSYNMPPDALMVHHMNSNNQFPCEVPNLDVQTQHLLAQNNALLRQIAANLTGNEGPSKIQENIGLFLHIANNIRAMMNRFETITHQLPGIMNKIPPLPVPMNEELLKHVLSLDRTVAHAAPGTSVLQQDPRCYRSTIG